MRSARYGLGQWMAGTKRVCESAADVHECNVEGGVTVAWKMRTMINQWKFVYTSRQFTFTCYISKLSELQLFRSTDQNHAATYR